MKKIIAGSKYTFASFKDFGIANFDSQQITNFSNRWFQAKDPVKAKELTQKLKGNEQIKQLATNSLLLTLLYLIFEETTNFPSNRPQLHKEGLDILLKKWDVLHNISREKIHKKLLLQQKKIIGSNRPKDL